MVRLGRRRELPVAGGGINAHYQEARAVPPGRPHCAPSAQQGGEPILRGQHRGPDARVRKAGVAVRMQGSITKQPNLISSGEIEIITGDNPSTRMTRSQGSANGARRPTTGLIATYEPAALRRRTRTRSLPARPHGLLEFWI